MPPETLARACAAGARCRVRLSARDSSSLAQSAPGFPDRWSLFEADRGIGRSNVQWDQARRACAQSDDIDLVLNVHEQQPAWEATPWRGAGSGCLVRTVQNQIRGSDDPSRPCAVSASEPVHMNHMVLQGPGRGPAGHTCGSSPDPESSHFRRVAWPMGAVRLQWPARRTHVPLGVCVSPRPPGAEQSSTHVCTRDQAKPANSAGEFAQRFDARSTYPWTGERLQPTRCPRPPELVTGLWLWSPELG